MMNYINISKWCLGAHKERAIRVWVGLCVSSAKKYPHFPTVKKYFLLFQLKMWISFMIPKIEDGNNFGVSIQEDTLAEVQSVESEAAAFFDQISRYFISRAKIVSKVAKYPHIDDYRRAVKVSNDLPIPAFVVYGRIDESDIA